MELLRTCRLAPIDPELMLLGNYKRIGIIALRCANNLHHKKYRRQLEPAKHLIASYSRLNCLRGRYLSSPSDALPSSASEGFFAARGFKFCWLHRVASG